MSAASSCAAKIPQGPESAMTSDQAGWLICDLHACVKRGRGREMQRKNHSGRHREAMGHFA